MPLNIREILKKGDTALETSKTQTPFLDAQVLLCNVINENRLYLYTNPDRILTEEEVSIYFELIKKRIAGVPVQYLIKKQEFMGLDFYVEKGVLIPRPDTEVLVESVIEHLSKKQAENNQVIADLGTGSGAIAVSLAKYVPNILVYAVDISEKALKICAKNAQTNGVSNRIKFLKGDLFEPLKAQKLHGNLDVLVSNPPYIPQDDINKLQIEVAKYEPRLALDGGEDGLDFYRKIVENAPLFLKNEGLIALEVGHDQADTVCQMLQGKRCYQEIKKIKDLSGIERVVLGQMHF